MKTHDEVLGFLIDLMGRQLNLSLGSVRTDEQLERYGIDSLQWADIAYEISLWIGWEVSPEEVAACETISGLAKALMPAHGRSDGVSLSLPEAISATS